MSVTPYMSLTLPTVSATLGPLYATENNTAFSVIDSHNHTTDQGVPVPSDGININADLTFGGYNATVLRTTRYDAQSGALALNTDIGCLYVAGVDLYYNDGDGNQIQLTASGALNAASIGGIGGDYATSDASVAYSDSSKTFVFWQDTNKSALMDIGTILLRRVDNTSSAAVTIKPSTSLSVGYTLTLPIATPASLSFMAIDSSGNLSFVNTLTSLTLTTLTATNATITNLNLLTQYGSTAWTPTGTWVANTTYTGQYRRVGDSAQFRVKVAVTGTPTTSTLDINLPAAHTIDTTKLTGTTVDLMNMGTCTIKNNSTGSQYTGPVTYASTTSVSIQALVITLHTGTVNIRYTDVTQANPFTFANGDLISIYFEAPIVEYA